jgi:hypothetical protein
MPVSAVNLSGVGGINQGSRGRWIWRAVIAAGVLLFLWAVAQFYRPGTGFSSLISIGDALEGTKTTALKQVPHYVHPGSYGYDGAYYVQIALSPALSDPELPRAIDNLPYRARRILFSWCAWLLGAGQPAWVVQAHALLNVVCWLALGAVLLRWFPPTDGENVLRWFGVMFSQGVIMSVHNSLVDLPGLLLVALAVRWIEEGHRTRGGVVLAVAGLGKETNLLGVAALFEGAAWRSPRAWLRAGLTTCLAALPLAAWLAFVLARFGKAGDAGLNNFTLPFAGLAEKWGVAMGEWFAHPANGLLRNTAAATLGITAQFLFLVLWWRPAETWWRVGAAFALMMGFLSTPVWEGYPGAFLRVLLPMTVAFNVLVPRGRCWLLLVIVGNLSLLSTPAEFSPPAREFFRLAPAAVESGVTVNLGTGWHGPENHGRDRWRWTSGEAVVHLQNSTSELRRLKLSGRISSPDQQTARVMAGERALWSGRVSSEPVALQVEIELPPGTTELRFSSDLPARVVGQDPRRLGLQLFNFEIVVPPPVLPR